MAGLSGEDRVIKIWLALTFTPNGYGKTSIDCYQAIFHKNFKLQYKSNIRICFSQAIFCANFNIKHKKTRRCNASIWPARTLLFRTKK